MAEDKTNPHIIVYGNYIAEQNIETQNNYYGEEKSDGSSTKATDPLSAKALEPYIRAGLVTPDLMPAKNLSSGEVALLAHDIAERLKMKNFWPYFKEKWGSSCNSSVYCRFAKSEKAPAFLKKLNSI